jgi:hypothetical protein
VEKGKDLHPDWVFRTLYGKWIKERIQTYDKGRRIRLIAWDCFWGNAKGPFVPLIMDSVNSKVYLRLLQYLLLLVLGRVQNTVDSPIFRQDNAKIHTAANVKALLAAYDVVLENWPPYSPVLNPIQCVWRRLKEKLRICILT